MINAKMNNQQHNLNTMILMPSQNEDFQQSAHLIQSFVNKKEHSWS